MSSFDTLLQISDTPLLSFPLQFCLVAKDKKPFKVDGTLAKPNCVEDFVNFETLLKCDKLNDFAGIGISIQASKICAIDVDHCFSEPFNKHTIDERGKKIFDLFSKKTYCEFSFSGTGMRILFTANLIENYSDLYYTKNEKYSVEFYRPEGPARYVTVTGKTLSNRNISRVDLETIIKFLNLYMIKPARHFKKSKKIEEEKSLEECKRQVIQLYYNNHKFQELWFAQAPGSGKNESEMDFEILCILYESITTDYDNLKSLFEMSPYFKSKDFKHRQKWEGQDNRYLKYIFGILKKGE